MTTIPCTVYRGSAKPDTYLYIERADDFSRVPEDLLGRLGAVERVMDLELHPGRRLARAEVGEVIRALHENGFYLQLPPREHIPFQVEYGKRSS